jgi:ELWxxDGT repeat protein
MLTDETLTGATAKTDVNGTLDFSVNDRTHSHELWQGDGSVAGTSLVRDIFSGSAGSNPNFLTNVNGTLYFSAKDGVHGFEPCVLAPTSP